MAFFEGAKCSGALPPSFFFPVGSGGRLPKGLIVTDRDTDALEREAAKFCLGKGKWSDTSECDIRGECLQYALDNNEEGVFGGTSTEQRVLLRKSRKTA